MEKRNRSFRPWRLFFLVFCLIIFAPGVSPAQEGEKRKEKPEEETIISPEEVKNESQAAMERTDENAGEAAPSAPLDEAAPEPAQPAEMPAEVKEPETAQVPAEEKEPAIKIEEVDFIPEEGLDEASGLAFVEGAEGSDQELVGAELGNVTLHFDEANVTDILAALSQQTGLNVIWGSEVTGVVSLKLVDVPWEQAMDVILKANKLTYEREGNVIRVTTIQRLNEEKDALRKLEEAEKDKEPLVTEVVPLNFTLAKEAKGSLEKVLSKRGNVVVDEHTNSLIITEIGSNMEAVKKVALEIDTRTPQVMIEARIVETSATFAEALGIDWAVKGTKMVPTHWKGSDLDPILDKLLGTDATEDERRAKRLEIEHKGGQFDSNFLSSDGETDPSGLGGIMKFGVLDAYDFEIAWQALQSTGDTRVLSNPRVATLHNKEATILVGQKVPIQKQEVSENATTYTVEYQDVGTTLTVTATINKDDYVTLRIHPEVSEIGEWKILQAGEYPVINTKEADVEVLVKSGDTVVIGGLIYESDVETINKLPILGDIPVLGYVFRKKIKNKSDQEILVFVTPTVFGREEKEKIARELIDLEGEVDLVDTAKEGEEAFKEVEDELEKIIEEENQAVEAEKTAPLSEGSLPTMESKDKEPVGEFSQPLTENFSNPKEDSLKEEKPAEPLSQEVSPSIKKETEQPGEASLPAGEAGSLSSEGLKDKDSPYSETLKQDKETILKEEQTVESPAVPAESLPGK